MRIKRYDTSANWYKGNTHLHSIASDGGMDFPALAALYASAGYRFLFRTDHWVASDVAADGEGFPLLWIDGIELDGKDAAGVYYHIACLGKTGRMSPKHGLENALRQAQNAGALLVLAHPHWTGNTLEDALRFDFDGVEVYNHVCHWLNGKSNGLVHWEARLRHKPATLALAVDDGHLRPEHPGWNGGWIVVNAPECTSDAILGAMRRGNFYASCGPEFHSIEMEGQDLVVTTSAVQFVRLVGPNYNGERLGSFDGQVITEARFTLPEEWPYAYLEIEDHQGKRAWTNSLFLTAAES